MIVSEGPVRSGFFHMCAQGEDAKNFIVSDEDWYMAFNLIGVCAAMNPDVRVVAFSIEDTHPHGLLLGSKISCENFCKAYSRKYARYIVMTRRWCDDVTLNFNVIPVVEESHLMNVGTYVIAQATKDGKKIMPYDYLWGTGSMYFRSSTHIPIWLIGNGMTVIRPKRIGDLTIRERRSLLHMKNDVVPDDWMVANGFLLPDNYVDKRLFENIYMTHNRFRVFCSISNKVFQEVNTIIASYNGVSMEDQEARRVCLDTCRELFGTGDSRRLDMSRRLQLAQIIRRKYNLSIRQVSSLTHIPEQELRKYL